MADVQLENGFTSIANELLEALYSTNFSEYENRILKFIIRYSYGCKKKSVSLQYWNDLCVAGIPANKIQATLDKLKENNVIFVDGDTKTIMLNKDYDKWRIGVVNGYDSQKISEILRYNLRLDFSAVIIQRTGLNNSKANVLLVNQVPTFSQSSSYKKSTPTTDNSNDSLLESTPKDNIKKDKENNITSKEVATPVGDVMDIFKNQVGPKGWFPRGPRHHDLITELAEKYTLEQIGDGIKEALKVNASLTLPGALQYTKTTIEGMIAAKERNKPDTRTPEEYTRDLEIKKAIADAKNWKLQLDRKMLKGENAQSCIKQAIGYFEDFGNDVMAASGTELSYWTAKRNEVI